jgi:hypothetical protein
LIRSTAFSLDAREHSVLNMRPIDRWGLDRSRVRYEAPRDLRCRKVHVRYSRTKFDRVIVFYKGERIGEAHPVDPVAKRSCPKRS